MSVILLGVILLILSFFVAVPYLLTIAVILIVIGLVLLLLGGVGHPVGGRRHWY